MDLKHRARGLIMSLPDEVLKKENRGFGMGVFLTISSVGSTVLPARAAMPESRRSMNDTMSRMLCSLFFS